MRTGGPGMVTLRGRARRCSGLAVIGIVWSLLGAACASPAAPASNPGTAPGQGSSAPSAPAAASAVPATPIKLTASYSELVTTDLPIWIAKETGLFDQQGLDVTLVLMESTTGLPALISGETQ